MQILFDMDSRNYNENGKIFSRPSARGIIIRGEKVLLIYSKKNDFYKFPGGGIEAGESNETALIREVKEETDYICMLVGKHSDKWEMKNPDIDRNLLLLMEAFASALETDIGYC